MTKTTTDPDSREALAGSLEKDAKDWLKRYEDETARGEYGSARFSLGYYTALQHVLIRLQSVEDERIV